MAMTKKPVFQTAERYALTNDTIDLVSEKISEMYRDCGCSKKEGARARLLLEEALLKYQSRFGSEIELYFRRYRILGQTRFYVRLLCPSFDPFTLEENPMAFMISTISAGFETNIPTWKYRNLENEIVFTVKTKAKIGSLARVGIAVGAALAAGLICRAVLPTETVTSFVSNYVTPLSDAYAGIFCVMAVLLTFFAVALSIIHIGDMTSASTIGGKMLLTFFGTTAAVTVIFTVPLLPFFPLSGEGEFSLVAKSVYDIIVGFIPTNIVTPFLNFNPVHIMIVGAMFGFSIVVMGQKGEALSEIFDECNLVAVFTNNFLNKFIFLYVAFKVFEIAAASDFSALVPAGRMVAVTVGAEALLLLIMTVLTCVKKKIRIGRFFEIMTPSLAVTLSSANFGAAFSTVYDSLMDAGVDVDTANLSVNLGCVFFRPASTILFVFSSLFVARDYGVSISVPWLIIAIFLSIVFAGAMPNIPGAAVSVFPLLFAQLGIPAEAVALMIAINAFLQFVTVAVDTWCLQCVIVGMPAAKE